MISFTGHLDVPLPADEVFERLADMDVLDRWNPNVTTSARRSGDRLAVGSTYVCTIRRGPVRMTARSTLVDVRPGRSVTYEGSIAGTWSTDTLRFDPQGTGTRITFLNHTTIPRWMRLLAPVLDAAFQPQARRAVEGARRHLQDPTPLRPDTMSPAAPGHAGFRDYTPAFLRVYDWWVIGVMARFVWRCPVEPMVDAHRRDVGHRHLDVGPGTGFLLARADLPEDVEITLLDPNPHVLAHAARTLADRAPTAVAANVLQPLPIAGPFDSAGLSNVMHCLPGPMAEKAVAVRHIADVLTPDGILIGSTVLGLDEPHSRAARGSLRAFNGRGAFDNLHDTVDGLRTMLASVFDEVDIEVAGSIALFRARRPSS